MPDLFSLSWFAGLLELILSPFVALGLFTRVSAFLASGEMAVGYWLAHAPRHFVPILNGGELAIMFCFAFLYIAIAGPGAWSVDALLRRERPEKAVS